MKAFHIKVSCPVEAQILPRDLTMSQRKFLPYFPLLYILALRLPLPFPPVPQLGRSLVGSIQPAIFCTASMPPCCRRALPLNGKSTPFILFQAPASASMSAFTLLSLKHCWKRARIANFLYTLSNECCCQGNALLDLWIHFEKQAQH